MIDSHTDPAKKTSLSASQFSLPRSSVFASRRRRRTRSEESLFLCLCLRASAMGVSDIGKGGGERRRRREAGGGEEEEGEEVKKRMEEAKQTKVSSILLLLLLLLLLFASSFLAGLGSWSLNAWTRRPAVSFVAVSLFAGESASFKPEIRIKNIFLNQAAHQKYDIFLLSRDCEREKRRKRREDESRSRTTTSSFSRGRVLGDVKRCCGVE